MPQTDLMILLLDLGDKIRGGQRQVLYLINYILDNRALTAEFKPILACPKSSELYAEAIKRNIPVFGLNGRRFWNPIVYFQLKRFICKHKKVLIHTNDAHSATLGAALANNNANALIIHTRRVSYPVRSKRSVENYKQANAIVAVSQEVSRILNQCGVNQDKIRVIHSGIDPRLYTNKAIGDHNPLRFVIIGALTSEKGHDALIRAAGLLKSESKMPSFEVIIVGDGRLLKSLKNLADCIGVNNLIRFAGRQESGDILPQCDILISASISEGSSGVIKEGWATSLPVIASDLASNLELVRDMENGATFSTGNPESLAKTMLALAVDPVLRKRLAKEGGLSVSNFTVERMALSYIKLYQELFNNYVLTATNKAGV